MMDNCKYDKVKIVGKLSCLAWFIEKHGLEDATKAGDSECLRAMESLNADLKKHLEVFEELMCK